jgi:hypothetical protein
MRAGAFPDGSLASMDPRYRSAPGFSRVEPPGGRKETTTLGIASQRKERSLLDPRFARRMKVKGDLSEQISCGRVVVGRR